MNNNRRKILSLKSYLKYIIRKGFTDDFDRKRIKQLIDEEESKTIDLLKAVEKEKQKIVNLYKGSDCEYCDTTKNGEHEESCLK